MHQHTELSPMRSLHLLPHPTDEKTEVLQKLSNGVKVIQLESGKPCICSMKPQASWCQGLCLILVWGPHRLQHNHYLLNENLLKWESWGSGAVTAFPTPPPLTSPCPWRRSLGSVQAIPHLGMLLLRWRFLALVQALLCQNLRDHKSPA